MYKFIAIDIREYPDPLLASFFHDGSNGVKLVDYEGKDISLPEITVVQRLRAVIIAARSLGPDSSDWLDWADKWLSNNIPDSEDTAIILNKAAWWANENDRVANHAAFNATYAVLVQYDKYEYLFERCVRAVEAIGEVELLNIIKQVINDRD